SGAGDRSRRARLQVDRGAGRTGGVTNKMATGSDRETFASDFERVRADLPGAAVPWLGELRRSAMNAFGKAGFPGIKNEDWKYTNIVPALKERLAPVLASEARIGDAEASALLARAAGVDSRSPLLVFVDGAFRRSLSRTGSTKV